MLDQIISELPEKSGISITKIAEIIGANKSTLIRKLNINDPHPQLSAVDLVKFMKACDNFEPLKRINHECGYVAVKVKETGYKEITNHQLALNMKHAADTYYELSKAISKDSDGGENITKKEACICLESIMRQQEACMGMAFTLMNLCDR